MANEIYENSWWGSPTATGWGNIYYEYATVATSEVTTRFNDRVIADGGIVEAISCVQSADFNSADWTYYFRVTDDGGIVESLECVTI